MSSRWVRIAIVTLTLATVNCDSRHSESSGCCGELMQLREEHRVGAIINALCLGRALEPGAFNIRNAAYELRVHENESQIRARARFQVISENLFLGGCYEALGNLDISLPRRDAYCRAIDLYRGMNPPDDGAIYRVHAVLRQLRLTCDSSERSNSADAGVDAGAEVATGAQVDR